MIPGVVSRLTSLKTLRKKALENLEKISKETFELAFRYLPCFRFEFSYLQAGFVKFTAILLTFRTKTCKFLNYFLFM